MDKEMLPLASAVALNAIFGDEPKFSHHLIDALGSAEAVFSLSDRERTELFGPFNPRAARIGAAALDAACEEIGRLSALGCQFLDIFDEGYPALLRECPDAPLLLYVRSATPARELFGGRPAVAVVGTRDQSLYGRESCQKILRALCEAPSKPLIVSGLAFGVDITAQSAALAGGLPTVGVSPVGVDEVYPRRHAAFVERMCATPGCALVTDYPPGTAPAPFTFLRRNRIIAGLSNAVLITESKINGGGLITCRLAGEYGRDVFALPGRIDDVRSAGCNALIGQKEAEAVWSTSALCDALGLGMWSKRTKEGLRESILARFADRPEDEREALVSLAMRIKACRGETLEELCRESNQDFGEVSRLATMLEAEGFIGIDLLQRCTVCYKI